RYISDFILNFVLPQLKEQNLGEVAIITRKNKDLDTMAAILSEQNVRFVKESSLPVFDHPIAQSIYLLLDFIQHKNYSSLLDFMRSEVAGLPPTDLKKAAIYFSTKIVGNASCETPENDTTRKAALGSEGSDIYTKVLSLAELYKADSHQNTFQNLLSLCYEIVKVFDFASVYAKESELKNLHYFLSIVADFMRNPKEFTPDVEGFLLYYQKMKQKKERKQQSTQAKGVINLLTIHKSKGLGFDTVFVYYDTIKKQDLRSRLNMDYLVDHSSFRSLKNVLFSLRYKFILEQVFADDYAQINQRNQTEEMNNIYVAFTRAKTNLGVYWLYKSSEIAQNKVPYAAKLVSAALQAREQYQSAMVDIPENKILAAEQQTDLSFLLEYFDPPKKLLVLQKKETEYDDISLKNKYLKNKNKLLGNATHLYLSFIKYDAEAEHELARLQVIKHYGNILSRSEIENIYSITRNFIEEKHHYFSHNWDLIFTEFPVFDSWSNLFRIDRMMINIPQKKILIVDYKTGKINDQQQLNNYKKIISQYCQNQNKDYQIEVEFAMVN
ncbi:MAG: hypothetical protein FWG20_00305, partial [Candidatus Cloacimonetes bacterium]|nr:hypothetical protein [Candidatus Cloacimonadota bacterium]